MGKIYGYARVSTQNQHEDRQLAALSRLGVPAPNIFVDHQSGKDFRRPAWQRLLRRLAADDTLFVLSIDRLGRNYQEIQEEWRLLTRTKGIDICIIDMPLLDTRRAKDFLGSFVSDLVLGILSFVADNERRVIRERQRQGIEAARKRGVKFGRPKKPLPAGFDAIYHQWRSGHMTIRAAARQLAMPESTFRYHAKKRRAQEAAAES